jgi:hypothetical protein
VRRNSTFFEDSVKEYVLAFIESLGVSKEGERPALDNLLRPPSIHAFFGLAMRAAIPGLIAISPAIGRFPSRISSAGECGLFR